MDLKIDALRAGIIASILLAGCGQSEISPPITPVPTIAKPSVPSDPYARCAGSLEMAACRKRVDEVASESPEAKANRIARLEARRQNAAESVAQTPLIEHSSKQTVISAPMIGMTQQEVLKSTWGKPHSVNQFETQYAKSEQWVYGHGSYVNFTDGKVTSIQSSR